MKRKSKTLRLLAGTVAICSLITVGSTPTLADTLSSLQNQYATLQQQQQQLQQEISSQKSQLNSENQKKAQLDASVKLSRQQIDVLNAQISALNAQISQKQQDIAAKQKSIQENTQLLKQRLRAIYEAGDVSYMEVLLTSDNIDQFLDRLETLRLITVHDTNLINSLKQQQVQLEADQAALKNEQANLVSSQSALAARQAILNNQVAQQNQIISDMKNNISSTQQQADEVAQQAKYTDDQINALIAAQVAAERAAQKVTGDAPTGTAGSLISFAQQYLGWKYQLGTAGPLTDDSTFDCSGFTSYVFGKEADYYLPHSAASQAGYGTAVSRNSLAPGDLVFFATEGGSRVTHVGIYIGGDQFIAANTSQGVSINGLFSGTNSGYWSSRYVSARRILK